MEFRILGPLEVTDGRRVLPLGGTRQRALLAILLLHANHPLSTARLTELLWQGQAPESAVNAIQVYVAHLRRVLEPDRASSAAYQLLVSEAQGYALQVQPDELDALRFERLVGEANRARADGQWKQVASQLEAALALWRGPALPEFASRPFAVAEVARLEDLRLRAREDRIDAELNLGRDAGLVPELRALVREYPLRERLCGQLMVALYRSGLQSQASDVYHRTRARLMDELGMEPGPHLERLFRDILRQAGYLESGDAGPVLHNLPQPLTSFIGRGGELTQLIERLTAVRLVTMTGTAGIGKTRLAVELARQVLQRFRDGIWLVDLAPVSDPAMIPLAVAAELRLTEQHGRSLTDTVAAYLRDRHVLLLLDNCERVVEAGADFALAMLSRCSELKILATSRQRLGLAGEQVWRMAPLAIPETSTTLDHLAAIESMQLLLERAALVQPDFHLSPSNASALVQICRRLDGIPLALELAAARMASLSPEAIAERLDDRLGLLATEERGRAARHQTLQAALEWSHDLLDQPEQILFRRLGVFSGTFDREAIDAVCTDPGDIAPASLVMQLVEKSLVITDPTDRNHFRLLESMREFARKRACEAGEDSMLGRKHADYYRRLVQTHGPKIRSPGARQHLAELDGNIDNIRAALAWASANDRLMLAQLAAGLHSYWSSRCLFGEALNWVTLALADPDGDPALRRALLGSAGWLEMAAGQLQRGHEHSQQALAAAEAAGDGRAAVRALINLSEAVASQGDLPGGLDRLTRALDIAEGLQENQSPGGSFQDQALLGATWGMIGRFRTTLGDLDAAVVDLQKATTLASQAGDCFSEGIGSCFYSEALLALNNLSEAEDLARQALKLAVAVDHRFLMLRAIGQMAAVAAVQGQPARALKLAAAVDASRGASGVAGFDEVDFWFGFGWSTRLEEARAQVGALHAAHLAEEGSRLSVYDAAAVALGDQSLIGHSLSARLSGVT